MIHYTGLQFPVSDNGNQPWELSNQIVQATYIRSLLVGQSQAIRFPFYTDKRIANCCRRPSCLAIHIQSKYIHQRGIVNADLMFYIAAVGGSGCQARDGLRANANCHGNMIGGQAA